MQDSEAVLDCAQSTMIDLEIRQQTIGSLNNIHCFAPVEDNGLQLHAAVARENNEGSIPNDTVSTQTRDEDLYELFKDFDFPDSTNTSLDTIALDLGSDWFRSTLQGNSYFLRFNYVFYFPFSQFRKRLPLLYI